MSGCSLSLSTRTLIQETIPILDVFNYNLRRLSSGEISAEYFNKVPFRI
jgi:hypothetical protein